MKTLRYFILSAARDSGIDAQDFGPNELRTGCTPCHRVAGVEGILYKCGRLDGKSQRIFRNFRDVL